MRNCLFTLLLLLSAAIVFSQPALAPLPETKYKLVVIAHRGNHIKVPENTLESVKAAIKSGADYVEIDLRTTKDGQLVIHHDATVDRMTNGTGNVKDLTLAEIQQLSVAGKNKPAKKTYRITTFSDVLKACK